MAEKLKTLMVDLALVGTSTADVFVRPALSPVTAAGGECSRNADDLGDRTLLLA